MELWHGGLGWAEDELKTISKKVLHQMQVPDCIWKLTNVKGDNLGLWIGIKKQCRRMPRVEANLADCLHSRPSRNVIVHRHRLLAGGNVPLSVYKIAPCLAVKVEGQGLGIL